jgi:23S rRNA (guanosine2251-2'-O)-methyltransferase
MPKVRRIGRCVNRSKPRRRVDLELIVGRNPVVDFLETRSRSQKLLLTRSSRKDSRVKRAIELATRNGVLVETSTDLELDELTQAENHQGCVLIVPPFQYTPIDEILTLSQSDKTQLALAPVNLVVALDGVTDPQNLGAVIRSAEAFGARGVVIPERRAAQVTSTVWKASAGALARLPVARVVNLSRTIEMANDLGYQSVGLDANADRSIGQVQQEFGSDPLLLVAGAEGAGLARLVRERCGLLARVPHQASAASLNVSVSVGIALYVLANKLD